MQTLHHELDQPGADPTAQALEIRALRERVAVLEAELAASRASSPVMATPVVATPVVASTVVTSPVAPASPPLTSIDFARTQPKAVSHSEFSAPVESAVVAADVSTAAGLVSNPGFAEAWTEQDSAASFEERIAEKAFFNGTTVDEQSRNWLLEN